jgi:alpha-tubulin N-acetyltransferase 1
MSSNQHTCYFIAEENRCIGFIKVGYKKLFMRNRASQLVEMNPLCVLDFYVSERV